MWHKEVRKQERNANKSGNENVARGSGSLHMIAGMRRKGADPRHEGGKAESDAANQKSAPHRDWAGHNRIVSHHQQMIALESEALFAKRVGELGFEIESQKGMLKIFDRNDNGSQQNKDKVRRSAR